MILTGVKDCVRQFCSDGNDIGKFPSKESPSPLLVNITKPDLPM